ncbi:MAG: response regulator [Gammaproteobacteria bacterium]|nr:response regulator [Gammaproteobacteria bacterium]
MSKVLVVDDSPTEIFQFKDILENLGHEVITADNGRDGVEKATIHLPDLVLMDIVMPGMNGFQATRNICRAAETKHIPVIIVSSKDQETDKVWGVRQGAKGYITKPVDREELISVINKLL